MVIIAVCGILLAVFGIMGYFGAFLDLMAACIPPVAGVMIADYWILKKGDPSAWKETPGVNWLGVVALVAGVAVALLLPVGISTINGVLTSMVLFVVLSLAYQKVRPASPVESPLAE